MNTPGSGGADSLRLLVVARQEHHAGVEAEGGGGAGHQQAHHQRLGQQPERQDRRRGTTLDEHQQPHADESRHDQPAGADGEPRGHEQVLVQPDEHQSQRGGQHGDARDVQRCLATLAAAQLGGKHPGDDGDRQQAERDVHEEHPPPPDVVGQEAADHRSGDEAEGHDAGEHGLGRGVAARSGQLGDQQERERLERGGAGSLHRPERRYLRHRLRDRAERGAEHEQAHPDQQHALPAVAVGQAGEHGQQDGGGDEVRRDPPDVPGLTTQVADDLRQRGADDGLVEHGQEQAGEHGQPQQGAAPAGEASEFVHM